MKDQVEISSIQSIIEDARNGKMFILVDHEDRENEGDLIIPGSKCNSKNINFMFFKITTEKANYPTNLKFIEKFLGIKKNEKFNFLNDKQIFVWEEDNYENLVSNFKKHIGTFENST